METTRSSAYHLARYTILPKVVAAANTLGNESFLLREVAKPILEAEIPEEFRDIMVPYAERPGEERFIQIVKWFLSLNTKASDDFEDLGSGRFRLKNPPLALPDNPSETELESTLEVAIESALDEGDQEAGEFEGWIYAFSFPLIVKETGPFPIKIGKTTQNVEARVMSQAKGSASFENPVVLGKWPVKRVGPTELAIHNTLKARNQWLEGAPGQEWFKTTVTTIASIVTFITTPA
jgi:hypothetical protein